MMPTGQCHYGAVRYDMPEETVYRALCHCRDCRRHSGSPMVAWGLVAKDQLKVEGEVSEYHSSEHGRRLFCPQCGTGLFYANEEMFAGMIDVQLATLDDPDSMPPQLQVQVADRIGWMKQVDELPEFERYPGP